ncbi:MAG: class I SAM-dependent methyltransferase [Bacteroidia bacterium]
MNLLERLHFPVNYLLYRLHHNPATAYNLIAKYYDHQPNNLLLFLDDFIFRNITGNMPLEGKVIADIGCGTGRHWEYLLSKNPANLTGFDVSENMLEILRSKHFSAKAYMQENNKLNQLQNNSCDLIICTLTIGYIQNIEDAFTEWNRVLKPGGEIIITDYHPTLLSSGGNRSFEIEGKSVTAKNNIHTLKHIENTLANLGFNTMHFEEKFINETVKHFYQKQNALHIYSKFQGSPIMYGIHLKKRHATV